VRRRGARALAALLAGFVALAPASAAAQRAVFVVRHAEKASAGGTTDIPLSDAGRARAERLAAMLRDAGITAIYSTDTVRTRSTAEPLARALGLTVRIYATEPREGRPGSEELVRSLRSDPNGAALVVGHSNTVPELLAALGATRKITLRDDEYDALFLIVPRSDGAPTLLELRY